MAGGARAGSTDAVNDTLDPAKRWARLRHPGWWALVVTLAVFAWAGGREYDYRRAVAEVKNAGPHWNWRTRDPVDVIRWDWRAAFRLATWTNRSRHLVIDPAAEMIAHALLEGPDFAKTQNLLRRLRPTALFARRCKDVNLGERDRGQLLMALN